MFSWVSFYGFTKVASLLELPSAVAIMVRCQGVISSFRKRHANHTFSPGYECVGLRG